MSKSKQSLNSDKTDEQKRLEYTARQKAVMVTVYQCRQRGGIEYAEYN